MSKRVMPNLIPSRPFCKGSYSPGLDCLSCGATPPLSAAIRRYDSNGNVLNDSSHQYSPDAEGRPVTLDTVSLTFDALNRMVEQSNGGSYTEIVYAPPREKLALLTCPSLPQPFSPLPLLAPPVL